MNAWADTWYLKKYGMLLEYHSSYMYMYMYLYMFNPSLPIGNLTIL